jgi:hypothetical protein
MLSGLAGIVPTVGGQGGAAKEPTGKETAAGGGTDDKVPAKASG